MIENEYGIKTEPDYPWKPQTDAIIDRTNQLLGNLVRTYNLQETYVYAADPWTGILVAEAFAIQSMYHRTKEKNPGQLVFGRDMLIPINHVANWRYICQRKKVQIENM